MTRRIIGGTGRAPLDEPGPVNGGDAAVYVTALPLKLRLRRFWRVAMSARGKAPDAELRQVFMASARKSGLVTAVHAVSRHGEEDVKHVLDWALKGRDPWGTKDFSE
jgi:hypothetical protein